VVNGRFFRRGGIDINPIRVSRSHPAADERLAAEQLRVPGQ